MRLSGNTAVWMTALFVLLGILGPLSGRGFAKAPFEPVVSGSALVTLREGMDAFRSQRYEEAVEAFQTILSAVDERTRIVLEFNLATCLFQLQRYKEAERRFGELSQVKSQLSVLSALNAGFSAIHLVDLKAAIRWLKVAEPRKHILPERFALLEHHIDELAQKIRAAWIAKAENEESKQSLVTALRLYRRALELDYALTQKERLFLNRRMSRIRGDKPKTLPTKRATSSPGVDVFVEISGGYDSNIGRASTHAGDISFLGAGQAAPIALKAMELDIGVFESRRSRLTIGYMYDMYAILDDSLESLSDHYHEGEIAVVHRLNSSLRLRSRAYGGVSAMGLYSHDVYQGHISGQLRLRAWRGVHSVTEIDVLGGRFIASGSNDFLAGFHGRVDVGQYWHPGAFRIHGEMRFRYRGGGHSEFDLLSGDLRACDQRCDGGRYRVTYSQIQPDLGLYIKYMGSRYLRPSVLTRLGYRYYLDEHFVTGNSNEKIPESAKTRADWVFSAGARLDFLFTRRWSSFLSYTFVKNASNMESTGPVEDNGWDYANKTFVQHTTELGIGYRFDGSD